jgi:hypothetical protein
MKYDGTSSHFDYKLTIFYNVYEQVELLREAYIRVFPIILKDLAKAHYFNGMLSILLYLDACNNMRAYFEGLEYYRSNFNKWNNITLDSITTKYPDKLTWEVV